MTITDRSPFCISDALIEMLKFLQKLIAAAVMLTILLTADPYTAMVASGVRMGRWSFSSSPPSSSRSNSAPSRGTRFSYSVSYYVPSSFGGGFYPAAGLGFEMGLGFLVLILVSGFLTDRSEESVTTVAERTSVLKLQFDLLGMARTLQKDLNQIAEAADMSNPEELHYVLTSKAA